MRFGHALSIPNLCQVYFERHPQGCLFFSLLCYLFVVQRQFAPVSGRFLQLSDSAPLRRREIAGREMPANLEVTRVNEQMRERAGPQTNANRFPTRKRRIWRIFQFRAVLFNHVDRAFYSQQNNI